MASTPTFVHITGELILRIGAQEATLGTVSIPVHITAGQSGDLTLTAETQQVREYVEAVFGAEAEKKDGTR